MVESSKPVHPAPPALKAAAQTSALDLASWSSEPLDVDTQGLFNDSPPEVYKPFWNFAEIFPTCTRALFASIFYLE